MGDANDDDRQVFDPGEHDSMSEHVFTIPDVDDVARIVLRCHDAGRAPTAVAYSGSQLTLTFAPDLTTTEMTTISGVVRGVLAHLTKTERDGIETDLAALRAFRQQSQSEFIALTQNQRDRALFDVVNAQTNVIRALLRDA